MEIEGYGTSKLIKNTVWDKRKKSCVPTKQMLIGYMLEYLIYRNPYKADNIPCTSYGTIDNIFKAIKANVEEE